MKKLLFAVITLFAMTVNAADVFNIPVTVSYGKNEIIYYMEINFAQIGDGTDSFHSQPILIGNAGFNYGYADIYVSNGYDIDTDVQVREFYSCDLISWTQTALDTWFDIDGLQRSVGTLGITNAASNKYFKNGKWLVLEFDGQTGNPADTVIKCWVTLYIKDYNGNITNLGGVAEKAKINP